MDQDKQKAATKIQSAFRGHKNRMSNNKVKSSNNDNQAKKHKHSAREKALETTLHELRTEVELSKRDLRDIDVASKWREKVVADY